MILRTIFIFNDNLSSIQIEFRTTENFFPFFLSDMINLKALIENVLSASRFYQKKRASFNSKDKIQFDQLKVDDNVEKQFLVH